MLEGSEVLGADFLVAVSQLKGLGLNSSKSCMKLEEEVARCLKSLQTESVDNKYVCMNVKRIDCEAHWKQEN